MIPKNLHASTFKYSVVRKARGFSYLYHQDQTTTRHQPIGNGPSFVLQLYKTLVSCITFSLVKLGFIAGSGAGVSMQEILASIINTASVVHFSEISDI